ncbi:unnamed protein product [Linum tenue]|uniref:Uncharacterized protein n=1 Tax=Linum tenue TaxID=586396 RepID=A0AAV0RN56_9ROSI|nr:unnamed protein product [Linum tenue]
MASTKVQVLVAVMVVASAQLAQGAVTCGQVASNISPCINYGLAAGLPGKCRVDVGFPISTSTDCSKVR